MTDGAMRRAVRPRRARLPPIAGLVLLGLAGAAPAAGQGHATVAVGGGVAYYHAVDEAADGAPGLSFVYRMGRPEGLRPTFGFNWYSMDFDTPVAGERVPLGGLRIRPVMGGYGYWLRRERVTVGATAIAGFAFNSFDTADAARLAYDRRLDELLLRVRASNSLAARAEIHVWYDVGPRVGLLASIGYVAARPTVTISTEFGQHSTRLRADAVKLQVGLVYGLF